MPYIEAKLSTELSETQKEDLQNKLTQAVSSAFGKPSMYIMTNIETGKSLYMGANKAENGAYLSISLLGSATKQACQGLTENICALLENDFNLNGKNVYITYHPTDLWGWNSMMF